MNLPIQFKYKPQAWPFDAIHVSIDLETASLANNAAIVQLAAVTQCPKYGTFQTFNEYISLATCESFGCDVDVEVMEWWNKQHPALRALVFGGTRSLSSVLDSFYQWAFDLCGGDFNKIFLWGNGVEFDITVLRNAMEIFREWPFNFRQHDHLRTVLRCTPTDIQSQAHQEFLQIAKEKSYHPHNALADAMHQYIQLKYCVAYAGGPDAYPPLLR